MKTVNLKKET